MKASILPLALLFTALLGFGHSEETSSSDSNGQAQETESGSLSRDKRSYNMLRLGRGLRMLRLGKRSDPGMSSIENDELLNMMKEYYEQFPESEESEFHPRIRRSTPPANEVEAPEEEEKEPELGGDDWFNNEEYGYDVEDNGDWEDMYEPLEGGEELDQPYTRFDDDVEEGIEKRPMSMLRLGKRPMSMLRLGKRPMSMLRLGKRPMSMLRLGKRPMSMLRLGKRPMSMLRLGKRPMSMLRLGKRPMSMLRLGKRPMSMLRLGKRPMSMLRLGKRPMSMLRLGKRPMSMLRLGKRQLRMWRLGKRDAEKTEDTVIPLENRAQ